MVLVNGGIFFCSGPEGDVVPGPTVADGLYAHDTRYLSEFRLLIGGKPALFLSSSAEASFEAIVEAANPSLWAGKDLVIAERSLHVRRRRLIEDVFYESIQIRNHNQSQAAISIELVLGCDFADIFEVRGLVRPVDRGRFLMPKEAEAQLSFGYMGLDNAFREMVVSFEPRPDRIRVDSTNDRAMVEWDLLLAPEAATTIELRVEPCLEGRRSTATPEMATAARLLHEAEERWIRSCTSVRTNNGSFDSWLHASLSDLRALHLPVNGQATLAAGSPWYVAAFGRDSLVTCLELLMVKPDLARETLLFLAAHQARVDDPARDAEPGKIMHELRTGELARSNRIPHTPYFGSADATPLFVMLAAGYYSWTRDVETMTRLRPSLDAALNWIDEYGDRDGDGFVEYLSRSTAGLGNHGWKDSADSMVHADGSLAAGPIALVEVQAYVYAAKSQIADLYEQLGETARADALRAEAARLKRRFHNAFWMPEEDTYALGLDGQKRQIRSVTSNGGHSLFCGIANEDCAARLVARLMAPDMFSGWGIRTLSSSSPAFAATSYHNGSVWPHDNAIVAAGFKRYGFEGHLHTIAEAMFEVAERTRDWRLPELLGGFDRAADRPWAMLPGACSPQAWASAAPFMLLQAMLGLAVLTQDGVLVVDRPSLPDWLTEVALERLEVGTETAALTFARFAGVTTAATGMGTADLSIIDAV